MLVLSRKPNQTLNIGDSITIKVVRVKGNSIQLGIEAPRDVKIVRDELLRKEPAAKEEILEGKTSQVSSGTVNSEPTGLEPKAHDPQNVDQEDDSDVARVIRALRGFEQVEVCCNMVGAS